MTLDYDGSDGTNADDEVEDLFVVLVEAKAMYPDFMGVSSGAIASTY